MARYQALRLRRFFMATLSIMPTFVMLGVLQAQGMLQSSTLLYSVLISATGITAFYFMFRSGWNLKAKDPSLTGPMMAITSVVFFWMMIDSATIRAVMSSGLCIILLFGVFRYTARVLLGIAIALLGAYAAILLFLWSRGPAGPDLTLDIGRLVVMASVLPLLAVVCGQLNDLRSRLEDRKAFFKTIWDTCNDVVVVIDAQGIIRYTNPAMKTMFDRTPESMVGEHVRSLQPPGLDASQSLASTAAVIDAMGARVNWETEGVRPDGTRLPIEVTLSKARLDDSDMVVAFLSDITKRKMAEDQIKHLANHDPLTGLPNRVLMNDRLQQAIASAHRQGSGLWVLFLDFDRFKLINDSLGHKYGDFVLTTMAARMAETCRESDTVARLGGDEFVMVLTEVPDNGLSVHVIERLMESLARPIEINGQALQMTSSIGIAVYPNDGDSASKLVEHADIAMYRAKQEGRNTFCFYTPSMNDLAISRLNMEGDLRHALENQEFLLHYQPQVDLATGEVMGAEALLRWKHPTRGMVSPADFIPMAEETGLIVPIGEWIIRTACEQQRAWARAGMKPIRVSINLSSRQFTRKDLVPTVARILQETGVDAHDFELELTESMVMTDVEYAIRQLTELKALGLHLSIDDFGTGYSSLAYLKRFPIDILKIDRSFVQDITLDDDSAAIVMAIITMAQTLKLEVVAEGVEMPEQLAYLQRARCNRMQGYLLSRPLPAHALEEAIRSGLSLSSIR